MSATIHTPKKLQGKIIKSEDTGFYIGYFDSYPELTIQAESFDEAKKRLLSGLALVVRQRIRQAAKEAKLVRSRSNNNEYLLKLAY